MPRVPIHRARELLTGYGCVLRPMVPQRTDPTHAYRKKMMRMKSSTSATAGMASRTPFAAFCNEGSALRRRRSRRLCFAKRRTYSEADKEEQAGIDGALIALKGLPIVLIRGLVIVRARARRRSKEQMRKKGRMATRGRKLTRVVSQSGLSTTL